MDKVIKELHQHLANAGFKSSIVSIQHLLDLQRDLGNLKNSLQFTVDLQVMAEIILPI